MSRKNFVSFGDAESLFAGIRNALLPRKKTWEGTQAEWDALPLADKIKFERADITDDEGSADFGTASTKDYTDTVRPNDHDLVESNAVYNAINNALSSIYEPHGDLSCADLTSALLINDNVGNVYQMSDSGVTSNLFINGAGITISTNDSVGIIKAGQNTIMFNYMGNAFDLHDYQKKELASAVEGAITVEGALGALSTNKATQAEVNDIVNVLGAKNFINNTSVSETDGRVQYTVNSDKSISINILSALSANAGRIVGYINVKAGLTYILTGGVSSKVRLDLRNPDYSMWMDNAQSKEVTSPKQSYSVDTFTPNNDATLMVYIRIDSSTATGNAGTVYSMLRLASDPDNTYEPYAMTNQQITPYVKAISNPNLLDNPWFTVNQRGQSSYTPSSSAIYSVDRWKLRNTTKLDVLSNGIKITSLQSSGSTWFMYVFEDDIIVGKTVTVSIKMIDGTIFSDTLIVPTSGNTANSETFTYNGVSFNFRFDWSTYLQLTIIIQTAGGELSIRAVKLELGTVSTLAIDTAPNYASELLKCQRYFVRFKSSSTNISPIAGFSVANSIARFSFWLPVEMRTAPTLTYSSLSDWGASPTSAGSILTPTAIATQGNLSNRVIVVELTNSSFTAGSPYILYASSSSSYIDFSADI